MKLTKKSKFNYFTGSSLAAGSNTGRCRGAEPPCLVPALSERAKNNLALKKIE